MPFLADRPLADAKAELFKAMAHPVRIRVLELLSESEHTIGELASATGLERRAGIVDSRRVRSTVVCSLRDPLTTELLAVARRLLGNKLRQGQVLLAQLVDGTSAPDGVPA